jgi:tetratricopeptide (TPR) repeat protein
LGNPDEALAYVKKALKLDPGNVDAYIYLGDIKKERGFFEEAIQAYQKAEELDKTVLDLWLNYSDLLVQMDNVPAAIDLMKKGSEYFKEAPEMLYRWACYEYLQGNKQLAYLLIEDAVVMNAKIAENELFSYVPMMKNDTTILHIIYRNKQNEN